jgi:hypothetical protein
MFALFRYGFRAGKAPKRAPALHSLDKIFKLNTEVILQEVTEDTEREGVGGLSLRGWQLEQTTQSDSFLSQWAVFGCPMKPNVLARR